MNIKYCILVTDYNTEVLNNRLRSSSEVVRKEKKRVTLIGYTKHDENYMNGLSVLSH